MDTHALEAMGFTKGELRVYFALLELGTTSSGPIILKSRVARSKVYEILERLKEKGLVSDFIRDDIRCFQALSPRRILDYLKSRKEAIREQEEEFKNILPELLDKEKSKQSAYQVKVYHGFEGVKTFYLEMMRELKPKDEYLGFAFPPEVFRHKPVLLLLDKFHRLRAEQGARAKILCTPRDVVNVRKLKYPRNRAYEFRVSKYPFPPSVSIFKETVATFIWSDVPRVFVIISPENAEHYRRFFLSLWRESRAA